MAISNVEDVVSGEAVEDTERIGLDKEEEFVRKIPDPRLPSDADVEKHKLMGHIPYRNWCPICVQSRGREDKHVPLAGKPRSVPEYLACPSLLHPEIGKKHRKTKNRAFNFPCFDNIDLCRNA